MNFNEKILIYDYLKVQNAKIHMTKAAVLTYICMLECLSVRDVLAKLKTIFFKKVTLRATSFEKTAVSRGFFPYLLDCLVFVCIWISHFLTTCIKTEIWNFEYTFPLTIYLFFFSKKWPWRPRGSKNCRGAWIYA